MLIKIINYFTQTNENAKHIENGNKSNSRGMNGTKRMGMGNPERQLKNLHKKPETIYTLNIEQETYGYNTAIHCLHGKLTEIGFSQANSSKGPQSLVLKCLDCASLALNIHLQTVYSLD